MTTNVAGDRNVAVGEQALQNMNPSGNVDTYNVGVGYNAGLSITTGSENTAVGGKALDANTTGNGNTAVGFGAGTDLTTATRLTAVGYNAAKDITTGGFTTAIGYEALQSATEATSNTAIGARCLEDCTSGDLNTAIGEASMLKLTTGSNNAALGQSGLGLTTGNLNVFVGKNSGNNLVSGNNNVFIGSAHSSAAANTSGQIVIGDTVTCVGSDNFTFGAGSTDSNIAFGATSITAPSDIRLKEDIQDEEVGLDFINDLRPVTFLWKKEKDIPSHFDSYVEGSEEERTMNGKYNHGFIAQEVKATIDSHGLKEGFEMWQENESDGRQRVAPAALMSVMVKAVQELSTTVDELKQELKTLKGE